MGHKESNKHSYIINLFLSEDMTVFSDDFETCIITSSFIKRDCLMHVILIRVGGLHEVASKPYTMIVRVASKPSIVDRSWPKCSSVGINCL